MMEGEKERGKGGREKIFVRTELEGWGGEEGAGWPKVLIFGAKLQFRSHSRGGVTMRGRGGHRRDDTPFISHKQRLIST